MLSNPSPQTVKNKISVVRKYIRLSKGYLGGIDSINVSHHIDAINRVKNYKTNTKRPIPIKLFRKIIKLQPKNFTGYNITTMLLLLYFGAFRQSEIAPKSLSKFNHRTNMCKKDIYIKNNCIYVKLRWGKNLQKYTDVKELCIPPAGEKLICPVYNYQKVLDNSPRIKRRDPVFIFKDCKPISVNYLRKCWEASLQKLNLNKKYYSLHSIRKSAASSAYLMGCRNLDIKRYGGWSSDAYLKYIQTNANKNVSQALVKAIQKS